MHVHFRVKRSQIWTRFPATATTLPLKVNCTIVTAVLCFPNASAAHKLKNTPSFWSRGWVFRVSNLPNWRFAFLFQKTWDVASWENIFCVQPRMNLKDVSTLSDKFKDFECSRNWKIREISRSSPWKISECGFFSQMRIVPHYNKHDIIFVGFLNFFCIDLWLGFML